MDSIAHAQHLYSVGRFREALQRLPLQDIRREPPATQLLRAELLTMAGQTAQAHLLLQHLEKSKHLTDTEKSELQFVQSQVARESGNFDSELQHLQRSISFAERADDLKRLCLAQFRLVTLLADRSGPDCVASLLSVVRANVTKLGEPTITARLHALVSQVDGQRGLLQNALHHTLLAQQLLQSSPDLFVEAIAQINTAAISTLRCDFEQALSQCKAALETSTACGSVRFVRSCLGNLGNIHLTRGEFDLALQCFDRIVSLATSTNEEVFLSFESMAQVYLARGEFEKCLDFVNQPDKSAHGIGRYTHRYSLLTKAQILARLKRWDESYSFVDRVITLSTEAGDEVLTAVGLLFKAEILLHYGRTNESWTSITSVLPLLPLHPPDMSARYERSLACLLASTGDTPSGRLHRDRAQRLLEGLRNTPALIELSRSWEEAEALGRVASHIAPVSESIRTAGNLVQNIATLMMHAGRPELLATGIIAILKDAESATGAIAVSRDDAGAEEVLASFGTIAPEAETRTLALGTARNRTVEVRVEPLPDIESKATVNALTMLLGTVHELELAQAEREERLTLWPIDELLSEDDDSVITGSMRELMSSVRKVARTNVTVLITGESGTGKEILARAIHGYSPRAKKPFVPFNCTAVPRELLESQLFGYKRGAFTGADRDNHGLIRTAKEGTLFLDEIGELGIDLQPKLLRFLESGEINPLGETSPFNVDVRIVAATNANLDRLVEEGRFREDLYYRLNVICLSIPPLRERRDEIPALVHHFVAKAAAEFGKGRIRVAEETMERLSLFSWPGNVRQLQNELRRMVALADADTALTPATLSKPIRHETVRAVASGNRPEIAVPLTEKLTPTLSRIEREMIKVALRENEGRVEATAKALGISRKGLYLKRQRLGV